VSYIWAYIILVSLWVAWCLIRDAIQTGWFVTRLGPFGYEIPGLIASVIGTVLVGSIMERVTP
jgi:hypothetical protein